MCKGDQGDSWLKGNGDVNFINWLSSWGLLQECEGGKVGLVVVSCSVADCL